jgi:acyl-CoA synthetase (AMP-forming)/AMP-acid ligase II
MPSLLRRAAEAFGERPFVATDREVLSFSDLDVRSAALAKGLLAAGVGKASRVALHLPNGPAWVTAWAAAARIGALVVPLSTLAAPAELRDLLRRTDTRVLMAPATILDRPYPNVLERAVPELASEPGPGLRLPGVPALRTVVLEPSSTRPWALASSEVIARGGIVVGDDVLAAVEREVVPGDELFVICTSGSTSDPKLVVHTHGAVVRRTSLPSPIVPPPGGCGFVGHAFFWVGGILNLGAALHTGATVVCQDRPDPGAALELIRRYGATAVLAWPTIAARLRAHPTLAQHDVDTVPQLGAPPDDLRAFHGSLGMTETMGPHSEGPRHDASLDERTPPLPPRLRGSYGAPVPFMQHRIVDALGNVLDDGVEGEICVRGAFLMHRMYKRERSDVFDVDGWYHTGDRGFLRDGYLFFTGRATDMIKTHGANVSPREVELALEAIGDVAQAFVFGVPDDIRGESVIAAVVPAPAASPHPTDLRRALSEVIAAYKVPREIVVLGDEEIPWLASGKADRIALSSLVHDRCESHSDTLGGDAAPNVLA